MVALAAFDLEVRITPRGLATIADDDGDGYADPDVVEWALLEATDIAHGILRSGWPDDAGRTVLIETDRAVRGAACDIAIGLLGARPSTLARVGGEASSDGPYGKRREAAEKTLERMASAQRRTREEGKNPSIPTNGHMISGVTRVPRSSEFIFLASSRSNRRPGGY